ncbi:MAG: dockerin type I domain-containing protein [Candidatus Bathyarchaeia archaeon]
MFRKTVSAVMLFLFVISTLTFAFNIQLVRRVHATDNPSISILNPGPASNPSAWNASSTVRYVGTPDFVFYSNETSSGSTFFVNLTVTNAESLWGWGAGLVFKDTALQYVGYWLPPDNVFAGAVAAASDVIVPAEQLITYNSTYQEVDVGAAFIQGTPIWTFNGTGTLVQIEFRIIAQVNSTNTQVSSSFTFDPAWMGLYYWPSGWELPAVNTGNFVYEFQPGHDVAVTDIALSKTVVEEGFSADINVTVANQGGYTETFNVTAYANATIVGSENVTLTASNSMTVTFTWNTTGFAVGNYTISAYAEPVPGETNVANNLLVDGTLRITLLGDVNGDGKVDMQDVMMLVNAFGSYPGHPRWNPDCDLNHDGRIDLADIVLALTNFG